MCKVFTFIMFKIVQTIEKGKTELSIVPAAWEQSGVLFWPKIKADKLIKEKDSRPENNWFEMSCKLKRNHLKTYQIAEEELERMLEYEDTEQEDGEFSFHVKNKLKVHIPKKIKYHEILEPNNYNSLAESCTINKRRPLQSLLNKTPGAELDEFGVFETDCRSESNVLNEISQLDVLENISNVNQETSYIVLDTAGTEIIGDGNIQSVINDNQVNSQIILDNQRIIISNQNKIIHQLAKFDVMFDEVIKKIGNSSKECTSQCRTKDKLDELVAAPIDPINSLDELNALEERLKDKKIMQEYIEKMVFICGKKGKGTGIDHCYTLIDRFFSRKFMTMCSWAGGSRDHKEKIPFKIYKNVIQLFFKLVYLADTDFTLEECEVFFKNVIRNSTRRNESNSRNSKSKRRPKNLIYRVKQGEENQNVNKENKNIGEKEKNEDNGNSEDNNGKQKDDTSD